MFMCDYFSHHCKMQPSAVSFSPPVWICVSTFVFEVSHKLVSEVAHERLIVRTHFDVVHFPSQRRRRFRSEKRRKKSEINVLLLLTMIMFPNRKPSRPECFLYLNARSFILLCTCMSSMWRWQYPLLRTLVQPRWSLSGLVWRPLPCPGKQT